MPADHADQAVAVGSAVGAVQFGGVEVRKPHLDSGGGVGGVSQAQAVAVADVAHDAREGLAGAPRAAGLRKGQLGRRRERAESRRRSEGLSSAQGGAPPTRGQARPKGERKAGWRVLRGGAEKERPP